MYYLQAHKHTFQRDDVWMSVVEAWEVWRSGVGSKEVYRNQSKCTERTRIAAAFIVSGNTGPRCFPSGQMDSHAHQLHAPRKDKGKRA